MHLECSPIFSAINYVQKNSTSTVKFNLPGSDIMCCEAIFISSKSNPGQSLIQFCLKGNNKSKSVSKKVVQCRSWPVIPTNLLPSILSVKWR